MSDNVHRPPTVTNANCLRVRARVRSFLTTLTILQGAMQPSASSAKEFPEHSKHGHLTKGENQTRDNTLSFPAAAVNLQFCAIQWCSHARFPLRVVFHSHRVQLTDGCCHEVRNPKRKPHSHVF